MLRLLRIEFLKIKAYKTFWAFLIIYALLIILFTSTTQSILSYGGESMFSFPRVWFNLAVMAKFFTILPSILIILLICNEFSFKTFRQNVVDGLSREQAVTAKFALIKGIALVCILFLFTYGMVRGLATGHFDHLGDIFGEIQFLFRLFLQIIGYMGIAALIAFLIRKTALAIVALLVYMVLEFFATGRIPHEMERLLPTNVFGALLFDNLRYEQLLQQGYTPDAPLSTPLLMGLTVLYFLLCLTGSRLLMQRSAI